jgi:hypothetical protein
MDLHLPSSDWNLLFQHKVSASFIKKQIADIFIPSGKSPELLLWDEFSLPAQRHWIFVSFVLPRDTGQDFNMREKFMIYASSLNQQRSISRHKSCFIKKKLLFVLQTDPYSSAQRFLLFHVMFCSVMDLFVWCFDKRYKSNSETPCASGYLWSKVIQTFCISFSSVSYIM